MSWTTGPVRAIVAGLPDVPSVVLTTRFADLLPIVVGRKRTTMLQLAFAARVVAQVVLVIE